MQISLDGQAKTEQSVLALGMFDGVHIGHEVLLQRAKALAKQRHVPLVACTFTTHPMQLIHPDQSPPMLTTLDERACRMEALGVDILCAQPFDRKVMDTPPEEYIAGLCRQFHPLFVVVGYNYSFGRKGEGTPELLRALGGVFGYTAEVVPQITLNGAEVSASVIRRLLGEGRVREAREMLHAPYQRLATVAAHCKAGYRLHMAPSGKQDVPSGAYWITLGDGKRLYPATLVVEREGEGYVQLPETFSLGDELTLRFYREADYHPEKAEEKNMAEKRCRHRHCGHGHN